MLKEKIKNLLQDALSSQGIDATPAQISIPNEDIYGDYSTPIALSLSKKLQKPAMVIANKISQNLKKVDYIDRVVVVEPGFVNFFLAKKYVVEKAEKEIDLLSIKTKYSGKNIIIEYSSPNIAKPFTVGHLRSTIIGDAYANLLEMTGSKVFRDNHLGDWGTQFGKLLYAIKNFSSIEKIETNEDPIKYLVALYVKFHDEEEINPSIKDDAKNWFKKLEEGDIEAKSIWQKCIFWSYKEFDNIYKKLGIKFTENDGRGFGESFFEDKMKDIVKELREKNLLKKSQGAELVFFKKDKFPPLMILKQDGTSLYATRDLAADKFRLTNKRYGQDVIIINEVGKEQSLYFKQLFEVEKMLGWISETQRFHIGHGLYRFKDSKMSTRKGNSIWLKDVLFEAEKRAQTLTENNTLDSKTIKKISSSVGIGALKWNDLKRSPHLDIVFDWEEILSMNGNSGPYIQYTYARASSIITRSKEDHLSSTIISSKLTDTTDLDNPQILSILNMLSKFEEIVLESTNNMEIHNICSYLFSLAKKYNQIYQAFPVINEKDSNNQKIRLLITEKTAKVLEAGLNILGIEAIKKM
jgi:arginyl-tRNA synthetase